MIGNPVHRLLILLGGSAAGGVTIDGILSGTPIDPISIGIGLIHLGMVIL